MIAGFHKPLGLGAQAGLHLGRGDDGQERFPRRRRRQLTRLNADQQGFDHRGRDRVDQFLGHDVPFDVGLAKALPYELENGHLTDQLAGQLAAALASRLTELRKLAHDRPSTDSPLFQLVVGWKPDLAHLKTDALQDSLRDNQFRDDLRMARATGKDGGREKIDAVAAAIGPLDGADIAVLTDIFLSYRAVSAWPAMVAFYDRMPAQLRRQVVMREQYALALNRMAGSADHARAEMLRDKALDVLSEVRDEVGDSAETLGLVGRIHKDRWDHAHQSGDPAAPALLDLAIKAYRAGFEADWRDTYPGINLVTLLEVRGQLDDLAERQRLVPVVRYGAARRLAESKPAYWDHATVLELAVLDQDWPAAEFALRQAAACRPARWEAETTARNLGLIRTARLGRGGGAGPLDRLIAGLDQAAGKVK